MANLIYNAIKTPDGTVLESTHRHDYKTHVDENGKTYMVDGGLDYARRNPHDDYEELSLYDDEPHAVKREVMTWGTRGRSGDQPLKQVKIKDMSTDHLKACLDTQHNMRPTYRKVMEDEIYLRTQESKS